MTIDRNSPVPIYHQLKTVIQSQIAQGVWKPGDRIPTEQELCKMYHISRSPVRQALKELVYEGVLTRRPGLGTFVQYNDGSSATPMSPSIIRMMTSDAHWADVLELAARVWNQSHPEQTVSFQIETVEHDALYGRLSTAVGNGEAPDAAMVDGVWIAGLAQSGFLYALDELDQETEWHYDEFIHDLYPAFARANSFRGRMYGLPIKADASLLWYRKDWFTAEGIDPPRDWDELLAVAEHFQTVKNRYGLKYPLVFPAGPAGGEATIYNLMPFIWSAGAEVFDAHNSHVLLDAPATRRALRFLRDLVQVHHAAPTEVTTYRWDTAPYMLATGQAAMALGGSYESDILLAAGQWSPDEFTRYIGYVSPPAVPGGESVSTVGGTSYVVLRQCARPTLVMEILKVAVRPNIVGDLYLQKLQNSPYRSFNEWIVPEATPLLSQTAAMIASGRARPPIPEYFKISRQLQAMFEVAISGTMDIDEVVQRAAEFIGAISERPVQVQSEQI